MSFCLTLVLLAPAVVAPVACSGSADDQGSSDSDSDSDSESETDADAGCEANPHYVACGDVPTTCAEIGPDEESQLFGCCVGTSYYFCQEEMMTTGECISYGYSDCCYDPELDAMYCG